MINLYINYNIVTCNNWESSCVSGLFRKDIDVSSISESWQMHNN